MKELKDYSLSVMSIAMALGLSTILVALVTTYVASMWWIIRHIWAWFAQY